jgi:hypothetical protein
MRLLSAAKKRLPTAPTETPIVPRPQLLRTVAQRPFSTHCRQKALAIQFRNVLDQLGRQAGVERGENWPLVKADPRMTGSSLRCTKKVTTKNETSGEAPT